ncbi:hypothetical protein M0657_008701 [Pyricularia oryzae]|uniref:Uncharacterized protein n=1 Tax=Pyricularia oryzae TaxID=318829 RepID=A0A4P7MZV8_PYROR|nr:hypothetical protein M0657_008701 [Pyricularia oryzae]KAI7920686.1 hypothetical protein M9X92_005771 [Pyricularia oryzae]QBZ53786.1 hypothetical protein PoMZ_09476 [Pyricularia oryzae]
MQLETHFRPQTFCRSAKFTACFCCHAPDEKPKIRFSIGAKRYKLVDSHSLADLRMIRRLFAADFRLLCFATIWVWSLFLTVG